MKKIVTTIVCALIVVAALSALLVGCVPTNPDKVVEKLEKAGYELLPTNVEDTVFPELNAELSEAIEAVIVAHKDNGEDADEDFVYVLFFESKEDAAAFLPDLKQFCEESSQNEETMFPEVDVRRSGNILYFGTEAGNRAANK